MGEVCVPTSDLLDAALCGTQQSYCLIEKKGENQITVQGSLLLYWIRVQEEEQVSCIDNENSFTEALLGNMAHTNSDTSVPQYPFLISITKMTASRLPWAKGGTTFGVAKQKVFMRAAIGNRVSTSSTLTYTGQHGEWDPQEVVELPAQKSWVQGKQHGECIKVAIYKANYPLPDTLIGKCRIHVLEEWVADKGSRVVSLPLARSRKGQYGSLSFEITIRQGRADRSASSIHSAAAEERQMVLKSLDRSVKLATLAWQFADEAVKRSRDPASRAGLRTAASKARHQTDRAVRRLRFAQALNAEVFAERAKCRLNQSELTVYRQNKRQAASRAAAIERDAAIAAAAALKAARSLEKRRQYCHVIVVVEVDLRRALGIVWSDVEREEIDALVAGHSGFARDPELPNNVDKPQPKSMKWFSLNGSVATKEAEENSEVTTISRSERDQEAELNQLDNQLAALSAVSRSMAQAAASAAGKDLRVADVLPESQAQALGIRVGWRAVAVDDVPLNSKRQLEDEFANLKARLGGENEATMCRSSVRIAFTKRVVLREERDRLHSLRRTLLQLQRNNSSNSSSSTMRRKMIQFDPRQPLGITWSQTTHSNSSGSTYNALEVSIEQTSDVYYRNFSDISAAHLIFTFA